MVLSNVVVVMIGEVGLLLGGVLVVFDFVLVAGVPHSEEVGGKFDVVEFTGDENVLKIVVLQLQDGGFILEDSNLLSLTLYSPCWISNLKHLSALLRSFWGGVILKGNLMVRPSFFLRVG